MKGMKTVWITKWALTMGIVETILIKEISETMIEVEWPGGISGRCYFHGNDYHWSYEDARAKVEKMRVNKIASLKKQIAKLENLEF